MSPADAAELLGVAPDAPIPDIQHAFAHQARLNHPDLLVDATDEERHAAGIRFAELSSAREVLLEQKPVYPVHIVADGPSLRSTPLRGPWTTFLVFLLVALVVVVSATLQTGFRVQFVQDLRGTTIDAPASP
jgi:hypothetical protein